MRQLRCAAWLAMLSGLCACSRSSLKLGPDAGKLDTGARTIVGDAELIAASQDAVNVNPGETGAREAGNDTTDSPQMVPDGGITMDASISADASITTDAGISTDASIATDAGVSSTDAGRDAAAAQDGLRKFVGNIMNPEVRSDFMKYWDQVSIGPVGQYGAVRSGPMQYNWGRVDAIYEYTRRMGIPFHEYAFILGREEPRYFATDTEARAGIEDWIRSFCVRYPHVELINVVYEPLHSPFIYKNALGGAGASGYDWIRQSFLWARAYCPNSLLLLTDYNTIENKADHDAFVKMVRALLTAGTPIDAIGTEGLDAARTATSTLKTYIDKLAALSLPLYVTSYNINEADDAKQTAVMKDQFPVFWTDERIRGITFWGYLDGDWRIGSGLVSSNGTPRPALTWLMSYLGR